MSCGVAHRCGSDPALLWLWHRPVAIAPTGPLAWEPSYALGAAPLPKEGQKNKERKNEAAVSTDGESWQNNAYTLGQVCLIFACV